MRALNNVMWYTGYLISIALTCWLIAFIAGTFDFWLAAPLVIGVIGALVSIYALKPPEPETFPVPFVGLSRTVGDQVMGLLSSGAAALGGIVSVALLNGVLGVLAALILVPVASVLFLMAAMLLPYTLAVDAIYLFAALLARLYDEYVYDSNTLMFVCPECGKRSKRPRYHVEGRVFEGLGPTEKGITKIEMESDSYPCFGSRSGRKDLAQTCPECEIGVETREGRPWVLTLAGAVGSGKTSIALSVMGGFLQSGGNGKSFGEGLYHSRDETLLAEYRSGICRPTPASFEPPRVLHFKPSYGCTQKLLYMFDVSGEFFAAGGPEADLQPQYSFNDAIVFAIDPSCGDPVSTAQGAYVGFMEKYREFNRMSASDRITAPLAVVVTHADAVAGLQGLSGNDLKERLVEDGYYAILNAMEKDFATVLYFACDAMKEGDASPAVRRLMEATKFRCADLF